MKKYEFTMRTPSATTKAVLTNVKLENGVLRAIKVKRWTLMNNGESTYVDCEHKEIIASGSYYLEEYEE